MASGQPIRVVHVLAGRLLGGADRQAVLLATELASRGVHSFFALLEDGSGAEEVRRRGLPVFILGKRHPADLLAALRLARVARGFRAHLLHTHTLGANFYGRAARLMVPHVRTVATMHGFDVDVSSGWQHLRWPARFALWQDRFTSRWSDRLIAVSGDVLRTMRCYGYDAWHLFLIRNAVTIPDLAVARRQAAQVRREFQLGPEPVLGTVGRMVPVKSQRTLLEAASLLRASGTPVQILLVGDGPLRPELVGEAERRNLLDSARFTGVRTDVEAVLSAMDVFCLPSLYEGTPLALLEAMSLGVPVVASRVGGVPEVVEEGRTGLLIAAGDAEALASAARELIRDRSQAVEMGRRARRFVRTRLSSAAMAEATLELYQSCLADRKPCEAK